MRVDPLFLATVAGLAGAGLVATAHPVEPYDPLHWTPQIGRQVRVDLLILDANTDRDWFRGEALALDANGIATGGTTSWVWFRPGGIQPAGGDTLSGRAVVERRDGGPALLLDGPGAARVEAPATPPRLAWQAFLRDAPSWEGRDFALQGMPDAHALVSPDGAHRCMLADAHVGSSPSALGWWPVTLLRASDEPAWRCRMLWSPP